MDFDESDARRRHETADIRAGLAKAIARLLGNADDASTSLPGLQLTRRTEPGPPEAFMFAPSLSVVVQGAKRVVLGETAYPYDEARFLLTALDLPTIAQVVQASPARPYISILLGLDLDVARQMIAAIDPVDPEADAKGAGMVTGPADASLFQALSRLLDLLDTPRDIPFLGDLLQKEILYRILNGPAGGRLRRIVRLGSQGNRVAKAIRLLRENYDRPLRVSDLAKSSGMGISTLHHHFRMMTAMSPLQFQKHLRLHEARRLMLSENLDAGNAALRVGYESPTQFSREYSRQFGISPIRDVRELRRNKGLVSG